MSRYTVFIEPTATGYSAHVPDLPVVLPRRQRSKRRAN